MKLGKTDDFEMFTGPDKETQEQIIATFLEYGINATIGG
jgi:hypothetical protein